MHSYTQAAHDAVTSGEREFAQFLLVDWNNTQRFDHPLSDLSDYVVSSSRDQTLTATAPDEVMLIEGYAAGKLTIGITGEFRGLSLAAHFAPYNGRSIFYTEGISLGVGMTYQIAVATPTGWEWFPQFFGVIRDVNTNREDGTVTLECLDNVERLRTSVDIPPYGLWQSYLQGGFKRGGLVDSSSIIDLAARSGGFTMGPDRWATYTGGNAEVDAKTGPILSVPFHGSILPEIGLLDNLEAFHLTEEWERDPNLAPRAEAYTVGPHGYLAHQAVPVGKTDWNQKKFWIDEWDQQAGSLWGTWVIGCWVYWPGANVNENSLVIDCQIRQNHLHLYVRGNDGGVEARIQENNGFLAWTNQPLRMTTPGWYYIEGNYIVESAGSYAMRVRIGDTYSDESRWSGRSAGDVNDHLSGLVGVRNTYALSDVYIVKAGTLITFSALGYDTSPADTARVSWGRNRVTYTLREDGREAWDLAKEVSSAEYGVVFFDEHGRFIFWNYRDMISRQSAPLRTFTIDDLESLALRNTFDSVRNVWTVTTQTGRAYSDIAYDLKNGVPFSKGADGQLYPADFRLPPLTGFGWDSTTFYFTVDDHTIAVDPNNLEPIARARGEFGAWEDAVPLHALKSYSGATYHVDPPNSEQKMTNRRQARLALSNGLNEWVGFVLVKPGERDQDGQPRFRIGGTMVHEDEPYTWSIRDEASIEDYGERVLELKNNFWLQDEWQTRGMLEDIVARMGRPIPVSDTLTVPGDPRIQLGDTIQVQDLDGFGENMWLQVYGIKRDYDEGGLTDTYTVEMVTGPADSGIWDSPTYGLWDQSFIWS